MKGERMVRILTEQEALLEAMVDACVDAALRCENHVKANNAWAWEASTREYQQVMHQAEMQLRLVVCTRMDERRAAPLPDDGAETE